MKIRNIVISVFVVAWLLLFHYESLRVFYLEPFLRRPLPQMKFLFPPAGWVMFFYIDPSYGYAQVYGIKDGRPQAIDPHLILQTRPIGYDNIHRNALVSVLSQEMEQPFCSFLKRKFPYFDNFAVTYINYPSVVEKPLEQTQTIVYECKRAATGS